MNTVQSLTDAANAAFSAVNNNGILSLMYAASAVGMASIVSTTGPLFPLDAVPGATAAFGALAGLLVAASGHCFYELTELANRVGKSEEKTPAQTPPAP